MATWAHLEYIGIIFRVGITCRLFIILADAYFTVLAEYALALP